MPHPTPRAPGAEGPTRQVREHGVKVEEGAWAFEVTAEVTMVTVTDATEQLTLADIAKEGLVQLFLVCLGGLCTEKDVQGDEEQRRPLVGGPGHSCGGGRAVAEGPAASQVEVKDHVFCDVTVERTVAPKEIPPSGPMMRRILEPVMVQGAVV